MSTPGKESKRERQEDPRARTMPLWRRVWLSVFRGPIRPRSDRDRAWVVFNHLLLHFRPTRLPEPTLRYTHTFGLGGMSLVLFVLLASTGILLMFVYEPTPAAAYESILTLDTDVTFGKLVRNVHHWSANLLIVVAFLHLLRVFFTGAYHGTRQFNWVLGTALLILVLASNFTGYLLPWDQLSYWAVTICTEMLGYVPAVGTWLRNAARGGPEIGSATLINFYTLHTTIVPVLLIVLLSFHFWRVRKARGVVLPRSAEEEAPEKPRVALALPNLLMRELAVGLALVAVVLAFSVFVDAPLDARANPGMSPNPAKAPWYFMGFQELLLHFDPLAAVVLLPLVTVLGLSYLPYVPYTSPPVEGVWFISHRGRRMGLIAAVTTLLVTPLLILASEYLLHKLPLPTVIPSAIANGVLPLTLLALLFTAFVGALKRRFGASREETIQTSFIALTTAFLVLTVTGIWFRGEGMALVWPWSA
jgi:quinol-cytochrome oxidoreductase complex cytochrome b subunit